MRCVSGATGTHSHIAVVQSVTPKIPGVHTIRFQIPIQFKPGQSVQIHFPGEHKKRIYSISSSPTEGPFVEITAKSEAGSALAESIASLKQGDQLKIAATADTAGAVNMLFPVVDRFQSAMDIRTGCSQGFSKQTQEGRRKVSTDLTLDYNAGKQTQIEKNLVKGTQRQVSSSIPACVTDSLSGIFYAASQRLTVGQDFGFPLADAMRTVTVTMKVEAREEIKTPAGTFQTIRVQPTAEEGVVKNRGNIWIWYTDDARHLPVQIRARLFWGTITFHLQSIEAK